MDIFPANEPLGKTKTCAIINALLKLRHSEGFDLSTFKMMITARVIIMLNSLINECLDHAVRIPLPCIYFFRSLMSSSCSSTVSPLTIICSMDPTVTWCSRIKLL